MIITNSLDKRESKLTRLKQNKMTSLKPLCCVIGMLLFLRSAEARLSDEEKEEIVRAHNYYRGKVDPIATNMEQMVWDDELAYMAQFWAANCEYELNENRNAQSTNFDYVGESLAAMSSYTVNYTILIRGWFEIGRNYNYYSGYCTDADGNQDEEGEACAPYTQLVWARTYAVGCGAVRCEELRGAEDANENALFLVCDYGPGGNFYGEPPYQTGSEVCSACPSDKPYCVNNLCAESGAPQVVAQLSLTGLLLAVLVSMF